MSIETATEHVDHGQRLGALALAADGRLRPHHQQVRRDRVGLSTWGISRNDLLACVELCLEVLKLLSSEKERAAAGSASAAP